MSTATDIDSEIRAKVAEQLRQLEAQRNDPAYLLEGMYELFRRIHAGEVEYGVPWHEAHAAVRSGTIYETHEVCVWLIAINMLKRMIANS
jgi:hypothetical protein